MRRSRQAVVMCSLGFRYCIPNLTKTIHFAEITRLLGCCNYVLCALIGIFTLYLFKHLTIYFINSAGQRGHLAGERGLCAS
jgi:TRAP-type C4-dicarboxylate transport system permease small subunit